MEFNMKVYTGGTFDVFHSGHANFLKNCKKIAGEGDVIVALNTDEFVERYKGAKPVISYEDRKSVLLACKYVNDEIQNVDGEDSKPTILSVKPDFLVIGDDWCKKSYYDQMNFTQKWLDDNGILLCYIPYTAGISSTEIKKRLKS